MTKEHEDLQLALCSLYQRVEELNQRMKGEDLPMESLLEVPDPPPLGETTCGFLYRVVNGDDLCFIARRFGTTEEELVLINQIEEPQHLAPGHILIIPCLIYRAQRGDSVNLLASRYGATTEGLIGANRLKPPFALFSGQLLVIPIPCELEAPQLTPKVEGIRGIYYKAQPGDSVFRIAGRFSLAAHSIIEANGLEPPFALFPYEELIIPVSATIYRAQPGDTLWSIAIMFGTTVDVMARFNNLAPPFTILPGEWLTIISPIKTSRDREEEQEEESKG